MKNVRVLVFALVVVLLAMPLATFAQGPGEGGPVIEGQPGLANIGSLNALRCSGTDCQQIYQLIGVTVLGLDPATADFAFGAPGGLATDWSLSDDGTELTVNLRDDVVWSDGTPITATDVKFTYDAIASGAIESDLTGFVDGIITGVEVVDDQTVVMSFAEADCTALNVAGYPVIPAHVFDFDGDFENFDYSVMIDHEYDTDPAVAGGVFQYHSRVEGQQVNLVANQEWADAGDGVIPAGYVALDVADFDVELDRFFAGETNYTEHQPLPRMQEVRDSGEQFFDYPANSYTYLGLNTADPENAVDGLDEDGNIVEQPPHPIFGDVAVRVALSHAINIPELIDEVLGGEGSPIVGTEIPTSWAVHPDLTPREYDPELADQMLTDAGWSDEDGDGIRECNGCANAEDGTPFSFSLITNDSNPQRVDIGVVVQDQLADLGIEVNFEAIDFNTVVDQLLAQNFDAVVIGWSLSFPSNPDQTQIFGGEADTVGAGFNFTSWVNADYIAANEAARTVPGCDVAERSALYHTMQEIAYDEAPYIFLYSPNGQYAARTSVDGFSPFANQPFWNVETWAISD